MWKYGFLNGLKLFFQIRNDETNSIKLPKIKYPFKLRKGSTDVSVFYQVFLFDEYKMKHIRKPQLIIDCGANVGLYAIKMKNEFPDAKIICIEPDAENFQQAKENLSNYKDVFLEQCGIWSKDTQLKVYDKYNVGKWGLVVEEAEDGGNVQALSIDTILKKYNIDTVDILKIDIETSEKNLFSQNYEKWLPKVKTIVIELHDWIEEGCSDSFYTAIKKTFKKYSVSTFGENTFIVNEDLL